MNGVMVCAITECFDRPVHLRGLSEAYTVHIFDSQSLLSDIYMRLISLRVEAVWSGLLLFAHTRGTISREATVLCFDLMTEFLDVLHFLLTVNLYKYK